MSTLDDAIAKLKIQGFQTPPDMATIQQMTGLAPEEKMALLQAARSGALPQQWGPVGGQFAGLGQNQNQPGWTNASGNRPPANPMGIPQQAVQQRDTQVSAPPKESGPAQVPESTGVSQTPFDPNTRYNPHDNPYMENDRSTKPHPSLPGVTGVPGRWNIPGFAGAFPNVPSWYNPYPDSNMQSPGNTMFGKGYPHESDPGEYGPADNPLVNQYYPHSTPAINPQNVEGGSTYDSQVPTAGGPDHPYNPNTNGNSGGGGGGFLGDLWNRITNPLINRSGSESNEVSVPQMPQAPDYADLQMPDYSGLNMPGPIDFEFVNRDFTPEGKKMAKEAFAPQYEALDLARRDTTDRYNTSDLVMKDMYEALGKDLTAQQGTDDARYLKQEGTQKAEAQAEQNRISQGRESSAALMAKIMGGASGDLNLKPQKGALAQEAAENLAGSQDIASADAGKALTSIRERGDSQHNYNTSMINASQLQGTASREGLIRALNSAQSGLDQQGLNIQSEERQNAQQLADQLFGRDQEFQNREYGQLQGDQQNAWNQYNAGVGQINGANQVANANIGQQNSAAQSQYGTDTENYWRQVEMDFKQKQQDVENQLAAYELKQKQTGGAGSIDNLGPMGVIKQYILNDNPGVDPASATNAFNAAMQAYGDVSTPSGGNAKTYNDYWYALASANQAKGSPIPEEVLRSAAAAIWAGINKMNLVPQE